MGLTVIHSAKVFDGIKIWPKATVIFDSEKGKILSISSSDNSSDEGGNRQFTFPTAANANIIDGRDHTVLPGLIEGHMHAHVPQLPRGVDPEEALTTPLRCGITTLCDMHSDPRAINTFKQRIKEETALARSSDHLVTRADLKSALFGATIDGGWPKPIVLQGRNTPETRTMLETWPSVTCESAAEFVRSNKQLGADYIKLFQEDCCSTSFPSNLVSVATLDLQRAVVDAAHNEGMLAIGHAFDLKSTKILLQAGVDGLAHIFMDQAYTEDLVSLYKQTNAFVVPTLTTIASLTGDEQSLRDKFAMIGSEKGLLGKKLQRIKSSCVASPAPQSKLSYAFDTIRHLHQKGIDVVVGTDAMLGMLGTALGPSLWMELELLVSRCGFSVVEALTAATSVAARRFRFEDRGTIEEGKRADLLLVKGDVIDDLEALWKGDGIVQVWKAGLKAEMSITSQKSKGGKIML